MAAAKKKPTPRKTTSARKGGRTCKAAKSTAKRRPAAKRTSRKAAAPALTPLEALIAWRNWTMLDEFWRELIPLPDGAERELEALALAAGLTLEQLLNVPRQNPGRVLAGVESELARLNEQLAHSGLAASALALAHELDIPNSATSKANCARALREALDRLRELAPPETPEDDPIDQLRARHVARVEGGRAT